jgi:hypothetical protein
MRTALTATACGLAEGWEVCRRLAFLHRHPPTYAGVNCEHTTRSPLRILVWACRTAHNLTVLFSAKTPCVAGSLIHSSAAAARGLQDAFGQLVCCCDKGQHQPGCLLLLELA